MRKTQHTALLQVTSHGSGGRAKIVVSHPFLSERDSYITSKRFKKVDVDTLLIGKFSCDPDIRRMKALTKASEHNVFSKSDFISIFGDTMAAEAREFKLIAERVWPDGATNAAVPVSEAVPDIDEQPAKFSPATDTWLDDSKVFVNGNDLTAFNAARQLSERRHVNVLMVGPSGYGKTSVPEALARKWEMNFIRWDCANVRDPEEFFGYREAVDGSTKFVPTAFTEAVQKGNAIVLLDELNRIEPYIANTLFPLLDHAGKTKIHGQDIEVGPNVIFVATVNLGYQFTGTFVLDTALVNRFDLKVIVRPLPSRVEAKLLVDRSGIEESDARRIVEAMSKLRELNEDDRLSVDASTRVSLQVADMMSAGLDMKFAITYVVLNGVPEEESKTAVDALSPFING